MCLTFSCRGDAPKRAIVEGTVSLDGDLVENGNITFYPTEQTKGPAAFARIKQGKYAFQDLQVSPVIGTHRVEIRWNRPTGKKDSQGFDIVQEAIPENFNLYSTLTAVIKPGSQVVDFTLQSK